MQKKIESQPVVPIPVGKIRDHRHYKKPVRPKYDMAWNVSTIVAFIEICWMADMYAHTNWVQPMYYKLAVFVGIALAVVCSHDGKLAAKHSFFNAVVVPISAIALTIAILAVRFRLNPPGGHLSTQVIEQLKLAKIMYKTILLTIIPGIVAGTLVRLVWSAIKKLYQF